MRQEQRLIFRGQTPEEQELEAAIYAGRTIASHDWGLSSTGEVDFSIFQERARWPMAPGLIFIADAIDQLGDAHWGTDDPSLDEIRRLTDTYLEPPERTGIHWSMVKLFGPWLINGILTGYIREVGGSRTRRLREFEWDNDAALAAIASGTIRIVDKYGVEQDHWVFLDQAEFELLMTVYGSTGIPIEAQLDIYKVKFARVSAVVMGNIAAIARAGSASRITGYDVNDAVEADSFANPSPKDFEREFGDQPRMLTGKTVEWLRGRLERWLVARIEDDHDGRLRREDLKSMSRIAFAPYWSEEHWKISWKLASANYAGRFKVGRPKGSGGSSSIA